MPKATKSFAAWADGHRVLAEPQPAWEEALRIHVGRSDFNADDWRVIRYETWWSVVQLHSQIN